MLKKGRFRPFFVPKLMQESTSIPAISPHWWCLTVQTLESWRQSRQQLGKIEASAMSGIKLGQWNGKASFRASLKDIEL